MQVSASTIVLGAVVLAAAGYAFFGGASPPVAEVRATTPPAQTEAAPTGPAESMPELPQEDPEGTVDPGSDETQAPEDMGQDIAPDREPAAITWSVPAGWKTVPNPSSMRIATYLADDAEVSV